MKKPAIIQSEFEEWAEEKLLEYASCSVPHPRQKDKVNRLVFGVFVGGGFQVKLGYETLYEGGSFSEAQAAFHGAMP